MEEMLSPTGVILEVLGDLELPIMNPIRKTDEGYEVMLSFPKNRKISKDSLKQDLENNGLKVIDIDAFREDIERYAWIVVVPEGTGAEIG